LEATAPSLSVVWSVTNAVAIIVVGLLDLGALGLTLGELHAAGRKSRSAAV
jgi:hypothetical protein